jgi:hypothetical protein
MSINPCRGHHRFHDSGLLAAESARKIFLKPKRKTGVDPGNIIGNTAGSPL